MDNQQDATVPDGTTPRPQVPIEEVSVEPPIHPLKPAQQCDLRSCTTRATALIMVRLPNDAEPLPYGYACRDHAEPACQLATETYPDALATILFREDSGNAASDTPEFDDLLGEFGVSDTAALTADLQNALDAQADGNACVVCGTTRQDGTHIPVGISARGAEIIACQGDCARQARAMAAAALDRLHPDELINQVATALATEGLEVRAVAESDQVDPDQLIREAVRSAGLAAVIAQACEAWTDLLQGQRPEIHPGADELRAGVA